MWRSIWDEWDKSERKVREFQICEGGICKPERGGQRGGGGERERERMCVCENKCSFLGWFDV